MPGRAPGPNGRDETTPPFVGKKKGLTNYTELILFFSFDSQ
jgi:hypothetical protein